MSIFLLNNNAFFFFFTLKNVKNIKFHWEIVIVIEEFNVFVQYAPKIIYVINITKNLLDKCIIWC